MKRKILALVLTLALLLPLIPAGAVYADPVEPKLIYGTSLSLENNIAVNFVMEKAALDEDGYTEPQVTFTFEGQNETVTDYVLKDGFYYFTFHGITANRMGKTITATPSAVKDSVRVIGETKEESVLSYCQRALDNACTYDYATLPTLIVDLLTYGAKSQTYFNYDTASLVTDYLSAEELALGTDTVPDPVSVKNTSYATVSDPEVTWYGAYLKLEDSIKLQFIFRCANTSRLKIELRDDQDNVVASFNEADAEAYGSYYRISCDAITPDRMSDALYLTACRTAGGDVALGEQELPFIGLSGSAVSNTLRYSIESYVAEVIPQESNAKLTALMNAMLNYGASAAAYVNEVRNQVPDPTATPVYTFDHTPTEDEMRAMAVKAMRDELSVQWYTPVEIHYTKDSGAAPGEYTYDADRLYGGMPYTSAGIGLFQFLNYYNARTGELRYTDSEKFNDTIGNTCGSSAVWALFSVCTTPRGLCTSNKLTKTNGFFPVGGLDYDESVTEFDSTNSTKKILQNYTAQQVYQAYAQVKRGDLLVYSAGGEAAGHTMMAIAEAKVITDAYGNIDDQSFIKIQDQRPDLLDGTASDGSEVSYFGRRSTRFYFSYLRSQGYLPVTTAEFLGTKAYEAANAYALYNSAAPTEPVSTRYFNSVDMYSNYPMAVAQFVADAGTESEQVLQTKIFSRTQVNSGAAFHWNLTDFANPVREALKDAGYAKDGTTIVTLRVTVSNGAVFEPVRFVYDFG